MVPPIDDTIGRLEIDKCNAHYTIKIPECLKEQIDKLPNTQKRAMKERILVLMARIIHDNQFDPNLYLSSD